MLYNLYATHRQPAPLAFAHALLGRRDRTDPELAPHLDGFIGFVMDRGRRPMTATRYGVVRHIQRVRHHLTIDVEDAHTQQLSEWAREANALVFTRDGAVRAPGGAVLVDPHTGDAEPGAELPHPEDARRRKAASERALAARGVRVPASLPPVVSAVEVELRAACDVVDRCLALFACAVRAESLSTSPPPLPAATLRAKLPRAEPAMSPVEREFFRAESPEEQDVLEHAWGYEALATLAWSVSLVPELPYPSSVCDVPALATVMLPRDGDAMAREARLRPTEAILDALDLTYRMHWALTEHRVNGGAAVPDVDPSVVLERHRALNWLTRFEDADWDDVDTPT